MVLSVPSPILTVAEQPKLMISSWTSTRHNVLAKESGASATDRLPDDESKETQMIVLGFENSAKPCYKTAEPGRIPRHAGSK